MLLFKYEDSFALVLKNFIQIDYRGMGARNFKSHDFILNYVQVEHAIFRPEILNDFCCVAFLSFLAKAFFHCRVTTS